MKVQDTWKSLNDNDRTLALYGIGAFIVFVSFCTVWKGIASNFSGAADAFIQSISAFGQVFIGLCLFIIARKQLDASKRAEDFARGVHEEEQESLHIARSKKELGLVHDIESLIATANKAGTKLADQRRRIFVTDDEMVEHLAAIRLLKSYCPADSASHKSLAKLDELAGSVRKAEFNSKTFHPYRRSFEIINTEEFRTAVTGYRLQLLM